MNIYDAVCLAVLLLFLFGGWSKGLVRSAFGIASIIITLFLTYTFFPYAVRLLRVFGVYDNIKQGLEQTMNLQGMANETVRQLQTEFIDSLPQSPFILGHLQANNNPEAYDVLNVSNLSGYIAGYFANMAVNLIAAAALFLIIRILLSLVLNVINILANMPVIGTLNRLGGAVFGLVSGLFFVWAAMCVLTLFFLNKGGADLYNKMEAGIITGFLYNNNPLMQIIVMLVPQ